MRSRSWRVARVASAHPAALGDLGARPRSRARRAAVNAATPLPAAPVPTDRRPLLTNALRREAVATHIVPEVPRLRRRVPLWWGRPASRMPAPFGRADVSAT